MIPLRKYIRVGRDCAIGMALAATFGMAATPGHSKKLIEFGWDEPDPAYMRRNAAAMDATPFDGCVFHVFTRSSSGAASNFTWDFWGKRAIPYSELQAALADLEAAPLRHLKSNFLRINVTPGTVDWFDDFAPVLANARVAARFARESGSPGVLFDVEEYQNHLFRFAGRPEQWSVYQKQVEARGKQFMRALSGEYPSITVFLTYGFELPWAQMLAAGSLASADYGLLAAFLNGMVAGARGDSRIVDGYENAYSFRSRAEFENARTLMQSGLTEVVKNRRDYLRRMSFGFGIWLDFDWRHTPWSNEAVEKNYFTPEGFGEAVRSAAAMSDEYVWIYSESVGWWPDPEGKRAAVPAVYRDRVTDAVRGGK